MNRSKEEGIPGEVNNTSKRTDRNDRQEQQAVQEHSPAGQRRVNTGENLKNED